jgi:hypothetical protein
MHRLIEKVSQMKNLIINFMKVKSKNMLNDIVDKIFVITTVNSNRVDYISKHLKSKNIQFEFFVAPQKSIIKNNNVVDTFTNDYTPVISLLSSYVSIFEMSKLNEYESICILEDDCFFIDTWEHEFTNFYKNLPTSEWDILHVGYHPIQNKDSILKSINEYVNIPLEWHHTTHCMVINKSIYNEYINQVNVHNYSIPADYVFCELYKTNKFNTFSPKSKFAYQLSDRSCGFSQNISDISFPSLLVNHSL